MRFFVFLGVCMAVFPISYAATWQVGPSRTYTFCSQVAPLVQDGDSILIDAATYVNDPQVKWSKNNLFIAGVGGRPRLEAGSIIANDMSNGKGIFVISGANVHVHNIEFANAVVKDHNGAGIRQEGPNLWVTHCLFNTDEMGILGGNIANARTTIEYCEFVHCGSPANPGYQHNIYINHIDSLIFRYNYSHDAVAQGHEVKSRASHNFILYNRIANEWSEDSRSIDLPNGGTAVIVGNIIEQGPNSANHTVFGYGLEGLSNPGPHVVYCCSNTFINKNTIGNFIQVANGMDSLVVKNNVFAGSRSSGLIKGTPTVLDSSNNEVNDQFSVLGFVSESDYDYHLTSTSILINKGSMLSGSVDGYALQPYFTYEDTCRVVDRMVVEALDIGAYEYPLASGISETFAQEISLFPNPARDWINVRSDHPSEGHAEMEIIGVEGKILIQQELKEGDNYFDVQSWGPGVYFIRITKGDKTLTRKIAVHY